MLMIVVIKLMAPKMEDTPARWREKMARSMEVLHGPGFPPEGGMQFSWFQYRIHFWERG